MEKESLEISNSKEDAVDGEWKNPGADLLRKLSSYSNSWELRKEAYLIAKQSVDERAILGTHKYPHHVIRGNKLVVHIRGVKAAYSRAKQMGIFSGSVKSHLEKHYKELGLYNDSTMKESSDPFEGLKQVEQMVEEYCSNHNYDDEQNKVIYETEINTGFTEAIKDGKLYKSAEDPLDDRKDVDDPSKSIEDEKNGKNRKRLYVAFIQHAKRRNKRNVFSSIFDSNCFDDVFSFIPESLRYFYRMANPVLCVIDDIVIFSLNELKKANAKNNQKQKYLIIASTTDYDVICIQLSNGKIFNAKIKDDKLVVGSQIAVSFDKWIQKLIGNVDFLNWKKKD